MRVMWTPEAKQDRLEIWEYIAHDNLIAAEQMDEIFSEATARLREYPQIGKPGKITGTRELIPHKNYRLVYEIHQETAWILALAHTAKRWPPGKIIIAK